MLNDNIQARTPLSKQGFRAFHMPSDTTKAPAPQKRRGLKSYTDQNARSLFLENFMNSSSDTVVTASSIVATAEATPSLP